MDLFDGLLDDPLRRPAVTLERRPTGARRTLRALPQGGWLGLPGPLARRRARRAAAAFERRLACAPIPRVEALGLDLGPLLHHGTRALAGRRGAEDIARLDLLRRAMRPGRPDRLIVPYDIDPVARLHVAVAREQGIETIGVQHGAYLLAHPLRDLEEVDTVAVWSDPERWPFRLRFRRPPHVIGHPRALTPPAPPRPRGPAGPQPRIIVLGYGADPLTASMDDRCGVRHYVTALRAIAAAVPGAIAVLRPHPADDPAIIEAVRTAVPAPSFVVDAITPILALLHGADLCVGVPSTAVLEAAVGATPVMALNLTGIEWAWPIGPDGPVPVARTGSELEDLLAGWAAGGPVPGRPELLEILGLRSGGEQDGPRALLALAAGRRPAVRPSAAPVAERQPTGSRSVV